MSGIDFHPVNMASDPVTNASAVLISGGSGMVGSAVRHALDARNARVLQLVRRDATTAGELKWNPDALPPIANPGALEGLTAAIHLSGANVAAHRWTAAYKVEMEKSRVASTHALCATLARLDKPPQVLIVASATGIYGDRGDEVLDEDAMPGSGFLADLCRRWEAAAQPAVAAGIRVVHARFGVVLSRKGGALAKMLPLFRLGLGGNLGSGRQWTSWISIDDLVAAVLFAIDTPAISGAVNVVAPIPITNAEFTRALAHVLNRPAFLPAPAFALRLALGEMADEALLASAHVIPAKLLASGFGFTHARLAEALTAVVRSGHPG